MYDFFMLLALFCLIAFLIGIIALFRPIPKLYLPTRTRALCTSLTALILFFSFVSVATRFKQQQTAFVPLTQEEKAVTRNSLLHHPTEVVCSIFREALNGTDRIASSWGWEDDRSTRFAQFHAAILLSIQILEKRLHTQFHYVDHEIHRMRLTWKRGCGFSGPVATAQAPSSLQSSTYLAARNAFLSTPTPAMCREFHQVVYSSSNRDFDFWAAGFAIINLLHKLDREEGLRFNFTEDERDHITLAFLETCGSPENK